MNPQLPYLMYDHCELFETDSLKPENMKEIESIIPKCDFQLNLSQNQKIAIKNQLGQSTATTKNVGTQHNDDSIQKNQQSLNQPSNLKLLAEDEDEIKSMEKQNDLLAGNQNSSKITSSQKQQKKNYEQHLLQWRQEEKKKAQIEQEKLDTSIIAPFSSSTIMKSINLEERGWFYIDESDMLQGPFTSIEMDNWYLKGFLDNNLKVSFKNTNKKLFFKMEQLLTPMQKQYPIEVKQFLQLERKNIFKRSNSLTIKSVSYKNRKGIISDSPTTTTTSGYNIEMKTSFVTRNSFSFTNYSLPERQQSSTLFQTYKIQSVSCSNMDKFNTLPTIDLISLEISSESKP